MLSLQHYDGRHPPEERMLSALHQNNDHASPTSGHQITTCNRKTKVAAFACDSEKLIMPPRCSFGRYLRHGHLCKEKALDTLCFILLAQFNLHCSQSPY
jgi:hypothetical protein